MTAELTESDCGTKHLKVAAMIVGLVMAMCTGTIAYCWSTVAAIDARVRVVEQNDAANAARFEAIQQALIRIERGTRTVCP